MRSESNTLQQCRPQTTATPRCTCSCDPLIQVQHSNLAAKKVSPWILQRALPSFGKLSGLKSKPTRLKCIRICANNLYLSLYPSATCIGNIVSIPSISWSTFCRIQRRIERPEFESVRHWKVCFDLPRPLLTNQSFRYCRVTLSYKMPSSTHELLAQFASKLQAK